ncbi:MAG TPA: LON peptidase substrate-binding domain-containing protein [Burkholderiaceae bacterium]
MGERIELFPLQMPLFPGGLLNLSVFEPRYLDLVQRCLKSGGPFGVVALIEGEEVRRRGPDAAFVPERFHRLGTLARIDECERPQPGLLKIRCTGTRRFTLDEFECLPHGLWVGEGQVLPEEAEVAVPPDLRIPAHTLQVLLSRFEQAVATSDLPVQGPYRWNDCAWLANRWAELLPLPAADKQRLLALDNPLLRLELVADELGRLPPN